MRTTLILPDALVTEAMELTNISKKTELIVLALQNLIQKEKVQGLKHYFGKVDLDIDIGALRQR
ncbi:MAG: type II toxin-antitoxin system VapB family antitoxin [Treponema sp.]|jgi:Arc/MetJ family transcription regulator|nr:type II toxin-antitoxin system VapB family antitoxin [Treponema sp.]